MPCTQEHKTICDTPLCILLSFWRYDVCLMYSTLSCGGICVKVFQLHSLWGRNRDDYSRTNREGRENKHWKHGHEQNPAGAGFEQPPGTSGTLLTPGGRRMEPDSTTAVYKGRQAGRGQRGKHLRQGDEAVNCNVVQCKGPVHWPVTAPWADCMSAANLAVSVVCPLIFWIQVLRVFNIQLISLLAAFQLQWREEERRYEWRTWVISQVQTCLCLP